MVSNHSDMFGGHRHCGSGVSIFLVVEEQDSACFCVNRNYCLSLKEMA